MENFDWKNLPFGYVKTDYNLRCIYRNGRWGEFEVSDSEYIDIHIAATGLHYGQEAFEGLKAYMGKDGKIRLFRWEENAKRLLFSANGIKMAEFPVEKFKEAVFRVVQLNKRFIPPYGSGAHSVYPSSSLRKRSRSWCQACFGIYFYYFCDSCRTLFQRRNQTRQYADMQGC